MKKCVLPWMVAIKDRFKATPPFESATCGVLGTASSTTTSLFVLWLPMSWESCSVINQIKRENNNQEKFNFDEFKSNYHVKNLELNPRRPLHHLHFDLRRHEKLDLLQNNKRANKNQEEFRSIQIKLPCEESWSWTESSETTSALALWFATAWETGSVWICMEKY